MDLVRAHRRAGLLVDGMLHVLAFARLGLSADRMHRIMIVVARAL